MKPQPEHDALIRATITDLLARLGVALEGIDYIDHEAHPVYLLKTTESGRLIGKEGETLHALNHVARRLLERKLPLEVATHVLFDVNNYHLRRIEELKHKALMLAERARLFKHDVEMMPMSAYERMIVHAAFANSPDITTESEGKGKFRRVILKYRATPPPSEKESS